MSANHLKYVPIKSIRENPNALRSVDRTTEKYLGLVDSIRHSGVLNAVVVRECKDATTGEEYYGLVDGLHRFTAAQDAGLTEIPAHIKSMEDADVLEAQILANIHKIETKPVEYSRQLLRILAQNPTLTMVQLAGRLSKSTKWLDDRLGLNKLVENLTSLVDEGKVNLSNAYALAKLPPEEQPDFLDRAITMQPQEFVPTVNARVKQIRDAKRQGRDPSKDGFVAVPHLRKIAELKGEMESKTIAATLVKEFSVTDPVEAFALAVKWVLHMDDASIEASKQRDAARKEQLKAEKEARKAEREAQSDKEAADRVLKVQEELATSAS